jgi:hypothetical protein
MSPVKKTVFALSILVLVVVAMMAAPQVSRKSRRTLTAAEMARIYGRQKIPCEGCWLKKVYTSDCSLYDPCDCFHVPTMVKETPSCAPYSFYFWGVTQLGRHRAKQDGDEANELNEYERSVICWDKYGCKQGKRVSMVRCLGGQTGSCGVAPNPANDCVPCTEGDWISDLWKSDEYCYCPP